MSPVRVADSGGNKELMEGTPNPTVTVGMKVAAMPIAEQSRARRMGKRTTPSLPQIGLEFARGARRQRDQA